MKAFEQVEFIIRDRLRNEWAGIERLPPGEELCRELKVSRSTLRRAFDAIAGDGLIRRQQGSGTYIADGVQANAPKLTGSVQDLMSVRRNVFFRVLERKTIPASDSVAQVLKLQAGEAVVYVSRVMVADDEPLAYIAIHLPYEFGRLILEKDLSRTPIISHLSQEGVPIVGGEETVEAELADGDTARLLEIPLRAPVLLINRIYRTVRGRPVDYVTSSYRANRYRYSTKLVGKRR